MDLFFYTVATGRPFYSTDNIGTEHELTYKNISWAILERPP